jgi:addiction module HigA family antidote
MYATCHPSHPGEVIADKLARMKQGSNITRLAGKLGVSRSRLQRVMLGRAPVKADLAIRLARILGMSPKSWLSLQADYDLWKAQARRNDRPRHHEASDVPLVILIMAGRGAAERGGRERVGRIHR